MNKLLISFLLILSLCASSCHYFSTSTSSVAPTLVKTALVGAAAGGLLGAGAGAIVGSLITNGDPVMSALLGAGIGIPVGAALSAGYQNYKHKQNYKSHPHLQRLNVL